MSTGTVDRAWQGGGRQATLFDALPTRAQSLAPERLELDEDCWVDLQRTWLEGADELFAQVVGGAPWKATRRVMYDRVVDVPRLTAFLDCRDPCLPPTAELLAGALSRHYGVDFDWVGANLYRDGKDSVAWHADRVGRYELNPLVAILSLGGPRRFCLRPDHGGSSRAFELFGGDLLVMGGACQHRWQHCVPKVSSAPPRVSLTFRHGLGRPT